MKQATAVAADLTSLQIAGASGSVTAVCITGVAGIVHQLSYALR